MIMIWLNFDVDVDSLENVMDLTYTLQISEKLSYAWKLWRGKLVNVYANLNRILYEILLCIHAVLINVAKALQKFS